MSFSLTLARYIAAQFLISVGLVFLGFLVLIFSIDIVEILNRTSGRDVGFTTVLGMSLLKLPSLGAKALPFAVLFGAILAFSRLARARELVVARAAGVSAWQFLAPAVLCAVLIGLVATTLYNPAAAAMVARFEQLEAQHVRGKASQLAIARTGFWLRQGDAGGQSVVHALRVSDQGLILEDVTIFLLQDRDTLVGRIDARSARLQDGAWILTDADVAGPDFTAERHATWTLPTALTPDQIQESFASPDTVGFWDLPRFIAAAEAAGFSALRHRIHFYGQLALPLTMAAMVLIGAAASIRYARAGGLALMLLGGVFGGFLFFFLNDVAAALGLSGSLAPVLAAAGPPAAALLAGSALLLHIEDG